MTHHSVCLTFDFDGVSSWIHSFESPDSPTKLSRGLFGVDVGAPRVLDLLDQFDVESTWFTPGHTIDSFPERAEEVWTRGHDIQHHGWSHTRPRQYESKAAERADIERGVESIVELTGNRPTGYRSPSWDFSLHTLDILRELGFEWDSSQMATDFVPYYVREGWKAPADGPFERGTETELVEVPVSWHRDDFPAFAFNRERGYTNERAIFRQWREQFDWMVEHVDGGVFVLTMHPQVIGHGHRLDRLESFIEHVADTPSVEFETVEAVVERFDSA
ncbi:polysaccharide deacetylase [Haloferax namakaokahaiae]|uniref:Polysaccharide deacetylase n=1 Tax=Haloferax namakaokahaiae TaxID=1748331 RepID=A0ABD5ZCX9_9EURY